MRKIRHSCRRATVFCLLLILGLFVAAVSHPQQQGRQASQGMMRGSVAGSSNHSQASVSPDEKPSYCKEPSTSGSNHGDLIVSAAAIVTGISLSNIMSGIIINTAKPLLQGLCDGHAQVRQDDDQFLFGTGAMLTYRNVAVQNLWMDLTLFAESLLALLIAIAGVQIILGGSPGALLPRLFFAFFAIFAFWQLLPHLIDLESNLSNELLSSTIVNDGGTSPDLTDRFAQGHTIFEIVNGVQMSWFATLVVVVMTFFLLLEALARIGLLDLLIVVSGPMILCYWHPAWQRWANTWLALFFVTLFVQPVQMLSLALAVGLMNALASGTLISMLVGIAVLFLVLKIPGWMSSTVGHAFGSVSGGLSALTRSAMQIMTIAVRAGSLAAGPAGGAAAWAGGAAGGAAKRGGGPGGPVGQFGGPGGPIGQRGGPSGSVGQRGGPGGSVGQRGGQGGSAAKNAGPSPKRGRP
jgi:hypothetical protein